MTYRELLHKILDFTDEQLDANVTVEDCIAEECHMADLRIGTSLQLVRVLDPDHPVIYF